MHSDASTLNSPAPLDNIIGTSCNKKTATCTSTLNSLLASASCQQLKQHPMLVDAFFSMQSDHQTNRQDSACIPKPANVGMCVGCLCALFCCVCSRVELKFRLQAVTSHIDVNARTSCSKSGATPFLEQGEAVRPRQNGQLQIGSNCNFGATQWWDSVRPRKGCSKSGATPILEQGMVRCAVTSGRKAAPNRAQLQFWSNPAGPRQK